MPETVQGASVSTGHPVVELRNIKKSFSGVPVLKGVDFTLEKGEIQALVGENGAGKSTLMNVLMGSFPIDEGEIIVNGVVQPKTYNINQARNIGLTIIPQELALVPAMTVAENIMLGHRPRSKAKLVDWKQMKEQAQQYVDQLGFSLDVSVRVDSLPIAYRQIVSIVKAIAEGTNVIIMDEPTSSLSREEVVALQGIVRKIAAQGISVIYISHFIDEIFEIADRITVLRDGERIDTRRIEDITQRELVFLMVGEELLRTQEELMERMQQTRDDQGESAQPSQVAMDVRELKVSQKTPPCSFQIYKGEVLGITGLVGAGKSEILRCIFGQTKPVAGEIFIDGKQVEMKNPIVAYEHGMSIIPEDRKLEGLCLLASSSDNISLCPKYRKTISKWGFFNKQQLRKDVDASIQALSIKVTDHGQLARRLSGGNQQKLVLAKALLTKPNILLLDEPTRGIDVGAKSTIYKLIRNLRDQGISILFCSSDVGEIPLVCDRTLVLRDGAIVKELKSAECTVQNILKYAAGSD